MTNRLLADAAGFVQIVMAALGDRLGLWRDLAANGPATSLQLARRVGLSERHVREWLAAMAAADYLAYDAATGVYTLRDDYARALAEEGGAQFLGGLMQLLVSYTAPYERLVDTFRTGGGLPQSAYPDATYRGHERLSAGWYEHQLIQRWLPAAGLDDKLADGASLCDVGCGGGIALVKLAQAFPRSRFVGYDVFGPNVHRARQRALRAGVADRVQFHQLDAAAGLPARFDMITTFDVVHDAVDPHSLLHAIQDALNPEGTYVCLEPRCPPHAALLYGISVLYCTSTSLAHGGVALGACGVTGDQLRAMAANAGFTSVTELAVEDPFNHLYALI
ncbi:MAG TPA: class I SAM-dependent methyltransferase [Kofleriaceae bacterium]